MNRMIGSSPPAHATTPARRATAFHAVPADHGDASGASLAGIEHNHLLRSLPHEDVLALLPALEMVLLPAGKQLFQAGDIITHATFPANAIISLQSCSADGVVAEIAMIGSDSVAGVSTYPGERALYTAVVHSGGYGYRITSSALRAAFFAGGPLAQLLMRHTSALFAHLARALTAMCHSNIEQRLCCWLLERTDRSLSDQLHVTQELIATMLSVRRESITSAFGTLQDDGLIACRRGVVTIVDRDALACRAGDCYQAMRLSA